MTEAHVWTDDGGREVVRAAPTPVPGLVIVADEPDAPYDWCVIHAASGLSVAKARDPEHALAVAMAMKDVCDWTLPASALRDDLPGMERYEAGIESSGGFNAGRILDSDRLAEAEAGGAP